MRRMNISAYEYRAAIKSAILREDFNTFIIIINGSTESITMMCALKQVIFDLKRAGQDSLAWQAIFKCSDFTATLEFQNWQRIPYTQATANNELAVLFGQYCDNVVNRLRQLQPQSQPTLYASPKP